MAQARVDTIVRGGQVVTSSQVLDVAVAIQGDKIVAVAPEHLLPPADRVIDAEGKFVLPGLIDAHVHLDGHDDYALGARAAAHAGMTTLIPFANYTLDGDETLVQAGNRIREEINASAVVDFGFHFILQNRPSILRSLPEAMEMGFKSFKVFMTYKKRPGRMCDDDYICEAMEMTARGGGVLQLHCESGNIIEYLENKLIAEGHTHPEYFPSPARLGRGGGYQPRHRHGRGHALPHLRRPPEHPPGAGAHQAGPGAGQRIWTETCPQYLLLSDAQMAQVGPLAKIGPAPASRGRPRPGRPVGRAGAGPHFHRVQRPLAPPAGAEKAGLGQHLRDTRRRICPLRLAGHRDAGASDVQRRRGQTRHAHHVAGPDDGGEPGPHIRPLPRKGVIQPGADADLLILDPGVDRVITSGDHLSNAGYSLFEGWEITGRPWMTLLRGQILLNDGKLEQQPGYGQFMECQGPTTPLGGAVS